MDGFHFAYCGHAATPADVWIRWNGDPFLLGALVLLAIVIGRGHAADPRAGWAALAVMVLVFVSPLCALSSALFSARVLHHVMLIAVVAPLLALAFPLRRVGSPPLAAIVGVHAAILWVWHAPGPYVWGLSTVAAYWLMQISLLGSAWLLWRAVLLSPARTGEALIALVATIGQMGLLGAVIFFAPQPLYPVHAVGAEAWGVTLLSDQRLGALLMWVPAVLPYLGAGLWLVWTNLRPDTQTS